MHLFHSVEQSIEICLRTGRLIETYCAITKQFRHPQMIYSFVDFCGTHDLIYLIKY